MMKALVRKSSSNRSKSVINNTSKPVTNTSLSKPNGMLKRTSVSKPNRKWTTKIQLKEILEISFFHWYKFTVSIPRLYFIF